jgi:hypothetical protein
MYQNINIDIEKVNNFLKDKINYNNHINPMLMIKRDNICSDISCDSISGYDGEYKMNCWELEDNSILRYH